MADRTRLAAAGFFLALALAAIPALLPVNLAGAAVTPRGAAAPRAETSAATVLPSLQLRSAPLPAPERSQPEVVSEGVLQAAISQVTPRSRSVAPGETLWKISRDAGISVQTLASANHLMVGAILRPGQVLTIPSFDPAPGRASGFTHEVAAGETLWGISRAAGVRVDALAAANHVSPDAVLRPGQVLVVPSPEAQPSLAVAPASRRDRSLAAALGVRSRSALQALAGGVRALGQPSEGLITSVFGWRTHPIFGGREFHTGVDIANRFGTPIRSAESGIVRFAGWMGGYGRLIIVAHANGLETSYSHLSAMLVALGQRVARGEVLGRMGNSGWSTGPHLFFEVRRNGVPIDPMPLLRGQRGIQVEAAAPSGPAVRPAAHPSARSSTRSASGSRPEVSPAPAAADGPAAVPPSREHPELTDAATDTPPAAPSEQDAPPH